MNSCFIVCGEHRSCAFYRLLVTDPDDRRTVVKVFRLYHTVLLGRLKDKLVVLQYRSVRQPGVLPAGDGNGMTAG